MSTVKLYLTTLYAALDLWIEMTEDMLRDYANSPEDMFDVRFDIKMLPLAIRMRKWLTPFNQL